MNSYYFNKYNKYKQKYLKLRGGDDDNLEEKLKEEIKEIKQKIDKYKWNNLEHFFDTYKTLLLKNPKYGNIICIRDWKINNDNLKGMGIGSYQLMFLLFNSDSDKIFVNMSLNDKFWKKFLNFGGKHHLWDYIRDTECGSMVEYEYPTLKFLKKQKDEINENKLYESAYNIIDKYEKNKYVIEKIRFSKFLDSTDSRSKEKIRCSKFLYSNVCRSKGCWWYYDTGRCDIHYGKLKNRN